MHQRLLEGGNFGGGDIAEVVLVGGASIIGHAHAERGPLVEQIHVGERREEWFEFPQEVLQQVQRGRANPDDRETTELTHEAQRLRVQGELSDGVLQLSTAADWMSLQRPVLLGQSVGNNNRVATSAAYAANVPHSGRVSGLGEARLPAVATGHTQQGRSSAWHTERQLEKRRSSR